MKDVNSVEIPSEVGTTVSSTVYIIFGLKKSTAKVQSCNFF